MADGRLGRSVARAWITLVLLAAATSAHAQIAHRATATNTVLGTSIAVNVPAGTVNGDVMVASISLTTTNQTVGTITDPSGWTLIRETTGFYTEFKQRLLYRVASSEPASYTWTIDTASAVVGAIQSYSGVDNITPVDVSGANANSVSTTTNITAPSITTTVANTMLVGVFTQAYFYTANMFTPPAGMTERYDVGQSGGNQNAAEGTEEARAATGATGTRVAVSAQPDVSIGALVALRPAGPATISSAANQSFVIAQASTTASVVTVTEGGATSITAANDLRIRIPATFAMTFDPTITTVTLGGTASAKVSTTLAAYEDSNQTAVLNVTSDFAAGETLTVTGLKFTNVTAISAADNLELVVAGTGGAAVGTDDKTITTAAGATMSSAANQSFVIGQASTTSSVITVTDAATATITVAGDIRIRIPSTFGMTFDATVTTVTLGGTASAKASTTLSAYEDSNHTAVINVTSAFTAGQTLTITGLKFTNFTAISAADNLELVVVGTGGATTDLDNSTITVAAGAIVSSAAAQSFVVGQASTTSSVITVTDAATATITVAGDIRIRIPSTFPMTFDTTVTTVTLGGTASAKASTTLAAYEDSNHTAVVNVTTAFTASQTLTITGLKFTNFTAIAAADNLELVVVGTGGATTDEDNQTKTIAAGAIISSAANQTFMPSQASTTSSVITVTDAATATITVAGDIRIRIPASFNMTFDTTVTTVTLGGTASAKASTTLSAYEDTNHTAVVNVTTAFTAGQTLTITGLKFTNFTALSAADNLELTVVGTGGATTDEDDKTITVAAATLSSAANQSFTMGQASTTTSVMTVTDAITATITVANDIRIRIPATFNMTFDTTVTTVTLGGTASAKVSTTLSAYEDSNHTAVLNVTTAFTAGQTLTITGLKFTNFTAVSTATNLQLVVAGTGGATAGFDDKTIAVAAGATISSAANQSFTVGQPSTTTSVMTVTEAASVTITAASDLRIRIPAAFNMTFDPTVTTVTLGGTASASVSTTLAAYEDSNHTAVLDVTTNFTAGQTLTVTGLKFTSVTAVSTASNLQAVTSGTGGATAGTDDKTITIAAGATMASAANQSFVVGQASTTASVITVTEAASATITTTSNLRIRIPAAFAMTFDPTITTVTLGGTASAKVSTTLAAYEDSNQTAVLTVTSNFTAGQTLTITGLKFTNFTAIAASSNLQLVTGGTGGTTAGTDTTTITIAAGAIMSSAANQSFVIGQASTTSSVITVTDAATATITVAGDIRIRIPAAFPMTFDTTVTTVTLGGTASAKASTTLLAYEDSNHTAVINVTTAFTASQTLTITGLKFTNFTAIAAASNLQLVVVGTGGATTDLDNSTITVAAGAIVSSAAAQSFVVGQASTTSSVITVTDAATATITVAGDIRIRIPAAFPMTFDTTVTTVTLGGTASAKASTTLAAYEDSNHTAVVNVTSAFTASQTLTITGLKFTNFTAIAAADNLELVVVGTGGATTDEDNQTKTIAAGAIISSAANQSFVLAQASTTSSVITVTDAATATITVAGDIRIRIPASFNMTFDTTVTTVTLGGTASAKASTTLAAYEDSNHTAVVNVTTAFTASQTLTITGLKFTNFTAITAADNLELTVAGTGGATTDEDDKTITVGAGATVSSAADQVFFVGQASTTTSVITVTEATAATITVANDIRIRIPATFNMTFDPTVTTVTLGGTASAKVSTTLSAYEDSNRTAVLNVTSAFTAGQTLTVTGLKFTSFTAVSAADNLELTVVGTGGATTDEDDKTITTVTASTVSSAANQSFTLGQASTTAGVITVTEAGMVTMTAANDIRIRIPATFGMTFDATITTVTLGGTASAKVSTTLAAYEDSNRTAVLNVTTDLAASETLTITGLKFTTFTAVSAADNLELVVAGTGGATAATDDKTITVAAGALISSAANQIFVVGQASTTTSVITVTEAAAATITTTGDIRIRIPATFNMTFDPTVTTVTLGGTASAKVSTTLAAYEDSNRTAVLNVTTNFTAGQTLTVSGLKFTSFTAISAADNLELIVVGTGGVTTDEDDKTIAVVAAATVSSAANQSFVIGQASTTTSVVTVTEGGTGTITAANDLRIRIPSTFGMTFDTTVTTVTLGGTASAKVSTTLSAYEDSSDTVVLNVTSDFAAGETLTITGLKFTSFTAISAADNLELVLAGTGGATTGVDDKTITIAAGATLSSAANQSFVIGQASTTSSVMTVTESTTATITVAGDIRIRIPATFGMTFDPTVTTVTLGGTASAKVSTTLSAYEDGNQTAVLNVTSAFTASQTLTITGLKFTNFTAISAADNLQLVVVGTGGATTDDDLRTITIAAGATISSAANQSFVVGQASTTSSVITVTDAATATITVAGDIRIRIPATFPMTFDTTVTTVTLGGTASAKASTTLSAYEDSNHTAVINVTSAFTASQTLTITGLKFTNFTAIAAADNLELVVVGTGGATTDVDNRTITIAAGATMSSAANQSFVVGLASTTSSVITVTDAATATITVAGDIRIRIPATFGMTFDTTVTTVTLGGTASAKASTTLSAYEDSNHTAVINVTSAFTASQTLTITGLKFTNFTAIAAADNLELTVAGTGGATTDEDDKTITIGAGATISSAANQTFNISQASTTSSVMTVTDAATATITVAGDIRIRIPATFNMTFDPTVTTVALGGTASAKVSTTLSAYEDSDHTAVLNVTTAFTAGQTLTITGLKFTNFTAVSSADHLELTVVGAGGATTDEDDKSIVVFDQSSFSFRKSITIDRSKVPSSCGATMPDFAMLYSVTDANLKTTANGGNVTSALGYDIMFRSLDDAQCGGAGTAPCQLDHEVESYNGTTGQLVAWVRIPALATASAASDTTIYIDYGNSDITTSIQNGPGVWNGNYMGVWHMNEETSGTGTVDLYADSTSNANHGDDFIAATGQTGKIDAGHNFNGTSDYVNVPDHSTLQFGTGDFTVATWVRSTQAQDATYPQILEKMNSSSVGFKLVLHDGTATSVPYFSVKDGSVTGFAEAAVDIRDGAWHRLVGVKTSTQVSLYLDGVLSGGPGSHTLGTTSNAVPLGFGKSVLYNSDYFQGDLDEVNILNVAQTSCAIGAQYNNQNAPGDIGAPNFYTVGAEESGPITEVRLLSFDATRYDRGVLLQWKTGYEIDNLGFNLYREIDGVRTKVNSALVGGSGLMAGHGTAVNAELSYARWDVDPAAMAAGVVYYLEDLDFNGTSTLHGPITPVAGVLGAPVPTVTQSDDLGDLGRHVKDRKVFRSRDDDREERRDGRRKTAPVQTALETQWTLAGQPAVKMGIRAPGWYRVTQAELAAAGLDPKADPRKLRLFVDGVEQAMRVTAKAEGRLAAGDTIEFYATGIDTPYTDTRVYWLTAGTQSGRRIDVSGSAAGAGAVRSGPVSFSSTLRLKDRSVYFAALRNGDQENWFGQLVSPEPADITFSVDHLDPTAPGAAQLDVTLQGVTSTPDGSLTHLVGVLVNGTDVGEMSFEGQLDAEQTFAVPAGALVEGDNTITLIARGGDADYSLVDSLGLTYGHTYQADADRLRASVDVAGPLTIGGFASAAVRVVDITDPAAATELRGTVRTDASGFSSVTVRVPSNTPRTLLAFSDTTISSPAQIEANHPSSWHAASQAHDWVAISHASLVGQVQPLADLREQQGHHAAVVDVEDVYDEFSFGEKNPQALKDFLQAARKTWRTAPRFVVLVGDATIDPRDYAGEGDADLVPTKQVPMSSVALETASDDWFVDFDSDGLPDVPIGRLSGRTAEQAAAMVNKIVSYDETGQQPWAKNVMLVADQDDDTSNFERYSVNLSALVPQDYSARTVFRGTLGPDATRQAIIDGVNDGQLIVNYTGHGSVRLWGGDGDIMTGDDVTASWRNGLRLPFVVAMNCLNGLFSQIWDEESLAEALQRAPDGGAVAVWASSSVTPSGIQALVNQELFRQIFQGGYATLGEAVSAAKRVVTSPDVRRSWIYFGDPAMRLGGAPQPAGTTTQRPVPAVATVASSADADDPSSPAADVDVNTMLDARGEPVRLVDFNRDGSADLMLYSADSGRWAGLFSGEDGTSLRTGSFGPAWQAMAANLNDDGRADLIFYRRDTAEWAQAYTTGGGTFAFTRGILAGGGPKTQLRVGDFDGDERDDLLIYDPETGGWTIGLSDGRGGFSSRRGTWPSGLRVRAADFNGDQADDIFGYDAATGQGVFVLSGHDARSSTILGDWGRGWRVSVANLGGRGRADLLFYNPVSGAWQAAINDGAGHFAMRTGTWAAGLEIHTTDMDGDRRDDVFGYNPATGQWMTALTLPSGQFAVAGGSWTAGSLVATGDVNGDGRGDVVLYDPVTGVWFECVSAGPGVFGSSAGSWLPGASLVGRPR